MNPERKTWVQAVKEERLREEQDAVNSLKDWERGTLKDVDPNYDCSDDSEDEEKLKKKRAAAEAEAASQVKQTTPASNVAASTNKKKK